MSIWDLYENIVAQMLTANGNELFYYTFMNEKTRHNYEIDFILTRNNKICPIEVNSSGYKTHASLDKFSEKYSGRIAEKYLVAIFTALFFRSRPSAMQQLESTAAQLLLAVWRAPYSGITASCHLQVNLRDVYHNSYRIVFSKPSVCHAAARIHCCAVTSRCMACAI